MQELKDVIEIHNGNQVTNTFNAAEYASRLAKLRTHMVDAQIDHVLFSSYQNINYYSDFPVSYTHLTLPTIYSV